MLLHPAMKTMRFLRMHVVGGLAVAAMLHASIGMAAGHRDSKAGSPVHPQPPISPGPSSAEDLSKAIRDVPVIQLKPLGTIDFSGNDVSHQKTPIEDTSEFGIDSQGRIGFLAEACGCGNEVVVVDRHGSILRTTELSTLPGMADSRAQARWIEGDRWIVQAEGSTTQALLLDMVTGSSTAIAGFDAPLIQSVAGTHDGGFVSLNYTETDGRHLHTMHAYDASGKLRWSVLRGSDDREASVTDKIAVTTSGRIVVYEAEHDKLVSYGSDGRRLESRDIGKPADIPPRLPGGKANAVGGVLVYRGSDDFALLLSPNGEPIGKLYPAYADGHRFRMKAGDEDGAVRLGPGGRPWASDGEAFMRLDDSGRADLSIGHAYDPAHLGNVDNVSVGPTGRIYAVDERTNAIHVFDRDGKFLHVVFPDPRGIDDLLVRKSLMVTDTEDLYVSRTPSGNASQEFVHFKPSGKLAGIEPFPLGEGVDPFNGWLAQQGTANRWAVGPWNAYLMGPDGRILSRLEAGAIPLHTHTYEFEDASSRPDGSLLVLRRVCESSPGNSRGGRQKGLELARVSADGDVTSTWPVARELQDSQLAFGGERIAFLMTNSGGDRTTHVLVTDLHGKPLYRFQPARAFEYSNGFLVRRGRSHELWIWIHDGKQRIDRYLLR